MKQSRFTGLLSYVMVFFLISCSGGGNENKTGIDSTTVDSTKSAVAPKINTIITAPQNMMIAKHKVFNYAKWKTSYDEHDSFRLVI